MIIKSTKVALIEERRKNDILTAQLAQAKEMIQFLGVLAAGVDVDELFTEEEAAENE